MTGTKEPVAADWPCGVVIGMGRKPAGVQRLWPGTMATPADIVFVHSINNDRGRNGRHASLDTKKQGLTAEEIVNNFQIHVTAYS